MLEGKEKIISFLQPTSIKCLTKSSVVVSVVENTFTQVLS